MSASQTLCGDRSEPAWLTDWQERSPGFQAECLAAHDALVRDLADPYAAQDRVLADIVGVSAGSAHWRERGYDAVAAAEPADRATAYRATLPVMRYDDFVPLIERETRTKGGILTCSPVLRWLRTSGTTGDPKLVPYTRHWLLSYRMPAIRAMWGTYLRLHPEILAHPYATLDTQTVREDASEFVQGVAHQAISNRHPRLNEGDWNPPWYEAPWFGPETPNSHDGRMYHRIRAMLGRDLHFIAAINPSTLISLRDLIGENRAELVRDVREGTLLGEPWGSPDPAGAERLDRVLADPDFRLTDVWPGLTGYSCWLSGSAGLYQQKLDAVLPGLARLPFMSCGTEGVTAIPVDADPVSQPLSVNQAFYEFVPADVPVGELLDAGEHFETLLFDEVEAGRDYHLVMSQANGLYRLWTGDIYRVERTVGAVPCIRFVRRDGVFHSFTGEKLTEGHVTEALRDGFAELGLELGLYLCGPEWEEPPRYLVVVESSQAASAPDPEAGEPGGEPGGEPAVEPVGEPSGEADVEARLSDAVDRALARINIEYASKRDSARLGPLAVHLASRQSVSRYVESRRTQGNGTQYKYKPFQQDTAFVQQILGR
ncbi:hypothetical protein ABH940_003323 [Streptacidiphilus sp. BW17]|uniref:GH3 family domain-containing protein n=1 Tax=Streptacidiphilus sp. BW17 TaxID=3156274 RepID=UPI0035136648